MCPIAKAVSSTSDGAAKGLVRKLVIIIFDGKFPIVKVWRLCSLCMWHVGMSMCLVRFSILFALTIEMTTELSSHNGVGSEYQIPS